MLSEFVVLLFKLCFNIVVAIIIIIASIAFIVLVLYLVSKCFDHYSKGACDNENDNNGDSINNESTFWILKRGGASYLCDKKPLVVISEGKEVYKLLDNHFYIGTEWFSEVKEEEKPVRVTIKIEEE